LTFGFGSWRLKYAELQEQLAFVAAMDPGTVSQPDFWLHSEGLLAIDLIKRLDVPFFAGQDTFLPWWRRECPRTPLTKKALMAFLARRAFARAQSLATNSQCFTLASPVVVLLCPEQREAHGTLPVKSV
jgi:hypothetical protein